MRIKVLCLKCRRVWRAEIEFETELELYASTFCEDCRKEMINSFEKQFVKKLLHYAEEGDGA